MKVTDKISQALAASRLETPCYAYDVDTILQRVGMLSSRLGTTVVLSLKANPCFDIVLRVHHIDPPFEVASLRELNIASRCSRIFVNTPAMDRNLIMAALGAKANFIVDSLSQLDDIVALAGTRPIKPVVLRLNTSVLTTFQPQGPALRTDQFGMDWPTALQAVARIRTSGGRLALAGYHLFGGSHGFGKFSMSIAGAAPAMIAELEQAAGAPLSLVNLGGGFGENWEHDGFDFDAYRALLGRIPAHVEVLHESGRGLFAAAGLFITSVLRTKTIGERRYAICDGGINQSFLLCQTENRFRKRRSPSVVRAAAAQGEATRTILVGNSCSPDDVIGEFEGPPLQAGDLCVFDDCGAYHSTYTVAPFLGLKEAKAYVLP